MSSSSTIATTNNSNSRSKDSSAKNNNTQEKDNNSRKAIHDLSLKLKQKKQEVQQLEINPNDILEEEEKR